MSRLDVTFKTLDGLTLSGWLYPAAQYGPGIIVSPGVGNMVRRKEHCLLSPYVVQHA